MLQVTVAIADFMWILMTSALSAGAGIATGVGGAAAGGYVAYRVIRKRRNRRRGVDQTSSTSRP